MKGLKIIGMLLLAVIFAGTLFFLYNKSKKRPDVYETHQPYISDVVMKTVATGSVVPRFEVEIKPRVSGIIDTLFVTPGQRIEKNQKVARIKIIPDMVTLNAAETRLNRARINFEDAETDYSRQKKLFEKNVISRESLRDAKYTYDSAREELNAAENNLQLVKNGVTQKAKETTNTLVRSTINGMVLAVPVEKGNSVIQSNTFNDGTTIATVANMNDMIFEGQVDETEVGKIREGMPIELEIGAIEKEKFNAVLEYISPKGVEENGAIQFEIKARVQLKKGQFIRSGYSANANIVLEKKEDVLVIPEGLLQFENDSSFVEVQTTVEQQFEKRYVKTGISDGINIEITRGLSPTDKIKGEKSDLARLNTQGTGEG